MPLLTVHLLADRHPPERIMTLLGALTSRYAEVLDAPVERVRVVVQTHPPEHWATGGEVGREAPYFTALVLADRPAAQRAALLAALTDVLVERLGCEKALVRGRIVPVAPEDWGIGGVPAAAARRDEAAARSGQGGARR